jgi:hypothetical protein
MWSIFELLANTHISILPWGAPRVTVRVELSTTEETRYYFLGRRRNCNPTAMMVAVLPREFRLGELAEEFTLYESRAAREELSLPSGSSWRELFARVDAIQSVPLRSERQPLEIAVINGVPGGRSAVVVRVHCMLADGALPASLFSKAFAGGDPGPGAAVEPVLQWSGSRVIPRARELARWRLLSRTAVTLAELADRERARLELDAMRGILRSGRWPVAAYRRARRLAGFRVPAVHWQSEAERRRGGAGELYLALVARILRGAFDSLDAGTGPLRLAVPAIPVDGDGDPGPAGASYGVVALSGGADDLVDLSAVRERTTLVKQRMREAVPTLAEGTLAGLLPGSLRAAIDFRRGARCDALATSVSLPVQGALLGAPVEMMFISPPAIGHAVSFSLTAHGEYFYLAGNADLGVMPVPLSGRVEEALTEVFGQRFESFASP